MTYFIEARQESLDSEWLDQVAAAENGRSSSQAAELQFLATIRGSAALSLADFTFGG